MQPVINLKRFVYAIFPPRLLQGIAGGAVVPLLYGHLKNMPTIGNNLAFVLCMLPCYLYILYYAIAGHKKRAAHA